MDIDQALPLLGGLSPQQFMKRHWQKKPLLVRQAVADFSPLLSRSDLFELASRDGVESRLLQQPSGAVPWRMKHGPVARRSLPSLKQAGWTLLVQGVDLHHDGVHQLLQKFRFVPDARLDDLMISYASDGGGVGPHFDSYDVFLLQAHGQRRWRIGRQKDLSLQADVPLKILENFEPEQEFVLEPGDMLYLPPRYAHEGVALGECMTYSIGFRAPRQAELARELLQRLAEEAQDESASKLYRDPLQAAVSGSAGIPQQLEKFAREALQSVLENPQALPLALGEYLTEPKSNVWFEEGSAPATRLGVVLDRRSRMMYDDSYIFINGEGFRASGRDAMLLRKLADQRQIHASDCADLGAQAFAVLSAWCEAGWVHPRG
ncbi:MAG: cupin domain-containing protein [Burkholderiaceae bacterium]